MTFIKGNFKQYIFRSDKGYVVGLFKIKDASDDLKKYLSKTITFTGYFNTLNETDLYIFYGKTNIHEKYGEQFMVDTYEITLPNDKDNIVEFLSSKLFPKIGEKTATKIVEVLGENCLDSILNNPDILDHCCILLPLSGFETTVIDAPNLSSIALLTSPAQFFLP